MNILFIGFVLLFQTIKGSELLPKKEEVNKALPLKSIRPGANLWSDEAVEIATKGPQNGGFADQTGNQVRRPIGYWEQPSLPSAPAQQTNQNRPREQQSFPSVGLPINKPEIPVPTQGGAKDRGWYTWNSPQWGSETNDDWTNTLGDSPSLLPLPQQSWGGKETGKYGSNGGGSGYGGKNSWSLPNLPDQNQASYGWNDHLSSDGLPAAPGFESEQNNWREPKWSFPQSDSLVNSLESLEHDWNPSASQWSSPSLNLNNNNNQKAVCICEPGQTRGTLREQSPFNQGSQSNNYPNFYPDSSNQNIYAPIRPNKQQRQPAWSHWDLPWNTWEKGAKEGKHKLKPAEIDVNEKEERETENEQEAETETETEKTIPSVKEVVQNKDETVKDESAPVVDSL